MQRIDCGHSPRQSVKAAYLPNIRFFQMRDYRYVIITPVRDEERFIESTIESVCRQSARPAEWVIVDDGSTDRTGDIIDRYAAQNSWITVVHRPNRGFRKAGGGVMEAFYDGYKAAQCKDWDFIVKLDGDLSFAPEYFEKCFGYFQRDPELGDWRRGNSSRHRRRD